MRKLFLSLIFSIGALLSLHALAQQLPALTSGHESGFANVDIGDTAATIDFTVAHFDSMLIRAIAPVDGAAMSVIDAAGQTIIPEGDPRILFVPGSLQRPPLPGGIFTVEEIEAPRNGNWTLRFTFPAATERTVVMSTVIYDSPYKTGITTDKPDYLLGERGVIGFLAFDHGAAATGLAPVVTVTSTDGGSPPIILHPRDDGQNGDGQANDGLYSVAFTPLATGSFLISGTVGFPVGTQIVNRTSEMTINVQAPRISILNTAITPVLGTGGCVNGLDVLIDMDVLEEGFYVFGSKLTGSNGLSLMKGQPEYLRQGRQNITFHFYGKEMENSIGNVTSWNVDYINALFSDPLFGTIPALSPTSVGSYTGSAICQPPIVIGPGLETTEIMGTLGGHAYISDLVFHFPVTVRSNGRYTVSFSIVGPNAENIESVMFEQNMTAGRNMVNVTVPGSKFINVDGPYRVVSVLVVGQGNSAIVTSLGQTKDYTKDQFDPASSTAGTALSKTSLITTGTSIKGGDVYVWGFRGSAQQGNGKTSVTSSAKSEKVKALSNIVSLVGGAYHLLALDKDGKVSGWGQSGYGETGCKPNSGIYTHTPCTVMSNAAQIATGEYFSIALDKDGKVWTWGHNLYGQLGNGSNKNSQIPINVNLNGEKARLIGGAYEGAFAVTEEGHVWAWGDNEASGLGIPGTKYGVQQIIRTPTLVSNLTPYANRITYIAGGNGWGEALLDDGTVIGWGLYAALGQGTTSTSVSSPVPVEILRNVKQLYARYVGSVALTEDGKVFTWGQTGGSAFKMIYGEKPTQRLTAGPVKEVGGGKEHVFYKTEDGALYGVGYNDLYKLNTSKCCAPSINWPGVLITY
ncbi:MAG: hypothetical protein LBI35_05270 [Burkholderiales bacterium]|jgi:alpha-tubulin suppressor-like RCC1 family protein|nr:hypothetical protein [Burkholderiales bacterium]